MIKKSLNSLKQSHIIKVSFFLVFGLYYCSFTFSQDILVLKNGDEVKVKVAEVLPDLIKYKKWENQDGPIYSEPKSNVFMIKYQNGTKDVFQNTTSTSTANLINADKFIGDWSHSHRESITITKEGELFILEDDHGKKYTFKFSHGVLKGSTALGDVTYSESSGNVFWDGREYVNMAAIKKILTQTSNSGNQNQTNQTYSPSAIVALKPAFTGLISLDTAQAIISIVFNSIEDEIGKGYEIKNKILELLKSDKTIKEISTGGIDTTNIQARYRLECNTKTFYNSSYSNFSKSTVYSADLRLSLYLWEINKSGRIIKGTPSNNKIITTKTFLGGSYVSKQGAIDALLSKIEEPLFQIFYAYFPIYATLTDITEANKKGEPKKVKISCGINHGVHKNFKFKIIDPARKDEEYDLEVTELFDDYSICKVKNNESIIATRFSTKDKIDVTTIYKLNK